LPGFFSIEGTPEDWATREIHFAFSSHRHWAAGHAITADCIANEPATLIEAILHIAAMISWCERDAMERAKQEQQHATAQANARGKLR